MKYLSGQEICVGDNVVADKSKDVVVCVIDTKQFTAEYSEFWAYLEKGCLVKTKAMGLVYYQEPDEDLILKSRK